MTGAALSVSIWASFALTALLIELTPGPNMGWLAALTLAEGRRSGLAAVGGITAGLSALGLVAATGLAPLIHQHPWVWAIMHWAGVAYLLMLAVQAWRDSAPTAQPSENLRLERRFFDGFLINILNLKAAVFYLVVLPEFLVSSAPIAPQIAVFVVTSVAIATLVHLGVVFLAGHLHGWLTAPQRNRRFRRVMALSTVAIAIWLAATAAPA